MAKEFFDSSAVYDGLKTWPEYYAQFETAKPELGRWYVCHPGSWQECFYKIVFIDSNIALGAGPNPFGKGETNYSMFCAKGNRIGWRDCDSRPEYRLRDISKATGRNGKAPND